MFGVAAATAWLFAVGAPGCGDPSGGSSGEVDGAADAPASDGRVADSVDGAPVDAGPDAVSFAALVDDPSRWKPIANPGACNLHEGNVVPDPFPRREWTACGPAWNMATNQTISIMARPGAFFWNVLAVSPTELYLGEIVIRPTTHLIDNIVRLEVSALTSLAAGAGWPQ